MGNVTVVLGPPASGKSTLVRASRKTDDVVVDFDALAVALGSTTKHQPPESVGQVTFAARVASIARVFDGVEANAWVIATNLTPGTLEAYAAKGVKFVVVDPGLETVLAQAEADGRPKGTEQLIRDWYDNRPQIPGEAMKTRTAPRTKSALVQIKTDDTGLKEGEFTGYASVFGNVDSHGDKVVEGAFTDSLKSYGEGGSGIPAYWSHRFDDPFMNIGSTVEAKQDAKGLFVKVALDLESPTGAQVHRLIKSGRVSQMSFAYDVLEGAWVDQKNEETGVVDSFYELRKLHLHEVSVVPVGANQETELTGVKHRLKNATEAPEGWLERAVLAFEDAKSAFGVVESLLGELSTKAEEDAEDKDEESESEEDAEANEGEKSQKSAGGLDALLRLDLVRSGIPLD